MRKKKAEEKRHFCRECAHATDFHSMSLEGQPARRCRGGSTGKADCGRARPQRAAPVQ